MSTQTGNYGRPWSWRCWGRESAFAPPRAPWYQLHSTAGINWRSWSRRGGGALIMGISIAMGNTCAYNWVFYVCCDIQLISWEVVLEETPEGEPNGDQESKERSFQHSNLLTWISFPMLATQSTHNWKEWVDNPALEPQDWENYIRVNKVVCNMACH